MDTKEEVIYEGKLYTVYYKYVSGYLEIKANDGLFNIKLVHERDVEYI
ncbi:hypothetical protein ACFSO7_00975 [Bacillus sp. CGMCC 1.16607]